MADSGPESEVRRQIDRLLHHAGWHPSEITEEQNLATGRCDYRLNDLCILEAKKTTEPDKAHILKLHLQQTQRYHTSSHNTPFLMVSDGELHFIQDTRNRRIERLFALPTKQQLLTLVHDPDSLRNGYIILSPNLFDFQKTALRETVKDIVEEARHRLLLEMATGTGKTVVAAEILSEMNRVTLERKDRRISALFLVDRDTLEEQAASKLSRHLTDLKVGVIEQLGSARIDVLVAQVATMQNRFQRPPFHSTYFDLIIVDEAHRSVHGGVWRKIIEFFECPQIGLTATPARFRDDETIEYFGEPVFLYSYDDGVNDGILAPFKIHRVQTNVDQQGLEVGGRFYESPDFGVRIHVDNRDWAIVHYYEQEFYGRKCLVFAASTKQVESLWDKFNLMFQKHGATHKAQFVISIVENSQERRRIVSEFQDPNSNVKILINLNILTAGFDYPELDLLFMCRYTENKSLYQQMKGRGSRLPLDDEGRIKTDDRGNPLKDHFVMADFVGVTQWENDDFQPHISASLENNPAEMLLNQDPAASQQMASVDVSVGIVDVKIIDPFEGKENPIIRELRRQLDKAARKLEYERIAKVQFVREVAALQEALHQEHLRILEAQRESFWQLLAALSSFSPFAPITEDLLQRVLPSPLSLDSLNESFGLQLANVQEHINLFFRERRHAELVAKKHLHTLTKEEANELESIDSALSTIDDAFYAPIIKNLRSLLPDGAES